MIKQDANALMDKKYRQNLGYNKEELELHPPAKPSAMVFVLECRVLSVILRGKMEGVIMKEVWTSLVLLKPRCGRHYTGKNV